MFSKMNEEQLTEYLQGDNAAWADRAKKEVAKRQARADAWNAGTLALPVLGKPGVYKTKNELVAA